jgi:hypothetical protein
MAASSPTAPSELVLKITLRHIRPPIWRRVRVASNMSLASLHHVIQVAMGWDDAHLHEFEVGDRRYGEPSDDDWPGAEPTYSESNIQLGKLVEQGQRGFRYVYDFGDGWEHDLVVERVLPIDPDQGYPVLVTGRRACPPEDCGGAFGYGRLLEALADPTNEEHRELTEWVGGAFEAAKLDLEAIKRAMAGMARRPRSSGPTPSRPG